MEYNKSKMNKHTTHFAGCDCYVRRADVVERSRIQERIDEHYKKCVFGKDCDCRERKALEDLLK